MIVSLIKKEIKDFWVDSFGLLSIVLLLILSFLFLWIFPDTSYPSYGLAESELYFTFMSYLMLFIVPAFAVGLLSNEYKNGTEELLRSLSIDWRTAIFAKFIASLIILLFIFLLTTPHIFVINNLAVGGAQEASQLIGAFLGLLLIGAAYIALSLMIASFIEQTTSSYIIAVVLCFMLYAGLNLLSTLPLFSGGIDFWLDRLSLSYHSDQMARGVLRLSSVVYLFSIICWSLWVASFRLNTKEV